MPRRKVTMLEAFEVSAREAQQREIDDRRRLAAERERAARRDEAGRPTQDIRRFLGSGVVGTLLSPFRGAEPVDPEVETPEAAAEDAPAKPSSAAHAGAIPIDRRPARASSWEAASVEPVEAPERGPEAGTSEPAEAVSSQDVALKGDSAVGEPASAEGAPSSVALGELSGASAPPRTALPEADEPARAEDDAFAIPMSGSAFGALTLLLLAAVFGMGLVLGGVFDAESEGPASDHEAPFSASLGARPAASEGRQAAEQPGARRAPVLPAQGPPSEAPTQQPASRDLSPVERAFLDPANRYSVLAITYNESDQNIELAYEAFDLLTARGLPVVRPYPWKGRIFVFVGASRTRAELDDTLRAVRGVKVPATGKAEFRSAHFVNTADYRR